MSCKYLKGSSEFTAVAFPGRIRSWFPCITATKRSVVGSTPMCSPGYCLPITLRMNEVFPWKQVPVNESGKAGLDPMPRVACSLTVEYWPSSNTMGFAPISDPVRGAEWNPISERTGHEQRMKAFQIKLHASSSFFFTCLQSYRWFPGAGSCECKWSWGGQRPERTRRCSS